MAEEEYALEWYKFGRDKTDDPIVKFMLYWIAFNWLYKECRSNSEKTSIRMFCRRNYSRLKQFNAFDTDAYSILKEKAITDEKEAEELDDLHKDLLNSTGQKKVENLIITIYQIRCNLFHGSKYLYLDRDRDLTRSSATIMKGYLEALFFGGPLH